MDLMLPNMIDIVNLLTTTSLAMIDIFNPLNTAYLTMIDKLTL